MKIGKATSKKEKAKQTRANKMQAAKSKREAAAKVKIEAKEVKQAAGEQGGDAHQLLRTQPRPLRCVLSSASRPPCPDCRAKTAAPASQLVMAQKGQRDARFSPNKRQPRGSTLVAPCGLLCDNLVALCVIKTPQHFGSQRDICPLEKTCDNAAATRSWIVNKTNKNPIRCFVLVIPVALLLSRELVFLLTATDSSEDHLIRRWMPNMR